MRHCAQHARKLRFRIVHGRSAVPTFSSVASLHVLRRQHASSQPLVSRISNTNGYESSSSQEALQTQDSAKGVAPGTKAGAHPGHRPRAGQGGKEVEGQPAQDRPGAWPHLRQQDVTAACTTARLQAGAAPMAAIPATAAEAAAEAAAVAGHQTSKYYTASSSGSSADGSAGDVQMGAGKVGLVGWHRPHSNLITTQVGGRAASTTMDGLRLFDSSTATDTGASSMSTPVTSGSRHTSSTSGGGSSSSSNSSSSSSPDNTSITTDEVHSSTGSTGNDIADQLADAVTLPPDLTLGTRQQKAVELIMEGKNVFLTGCAGTGKTVVLQQVIQALKKEGRSVAVTATTGIAACLLGGVTYHSVLGLGQAETLLRIQNGMYKRRIEHQWLDVLIVDEASMISAEVLQIIDHCLTAARQSHLPTSERQPFGGLQVVLCGDLYQLGPIEQTFNLKMPEQLLQRGFFFDAPVFEYGQFHTVELDLNYRQQNAEFLAQLQTIRSGSNKEAFAVIDTLQRQCGNPLPDLPGGVKPTRIFTKNKLANDYNQAELYRLQEKEVTWQAIDGIRVQLEPAKLQAGSAPHTPAVTEAEAYAVMAQAQEQQHCRAAKVVLAKKGAQVMLVRNRDVARGIVNGRRGAITGWCHYSNASDRPAYLDGAVDRWLDVPGNRHLPVVMLENGAVEVVWPALFEFHFPGLGFAWRVQMPLKLAWAITAHKSQGMTLDSAIVDLSCFTHGQDYVVLSRVRSVAGLQIIRHRRNVHRLDPRVDDFHRALSRGHSTRSKAKQAAQWLGKPPVWEEEHEGQTQYLLQHCKASKDWLADQQPFSHPPH